MMNIQTSFEWSNQFNVDGYLQIQQWLSPKELDELIQNVDRYIDEVVPNLPREHVFYEDLGESETLKQLQQMGQHDSYFAKIIDEGRFRELAESLLNGPVVAKNLQYFNKYANVGQPTPPHQDGYYFMLDPCEAITMWLALDEVDEDNGCVRYIPASHKFGMRSHGRTGTLGFSQGITDYGAHDTDQEVAAKAMPGDLLVHHAMTIHRADGNQSHNRSRRALGLIYYSQRAKADEAAHKRYQAALKQDMIDQGRI